jgi:type IX secretion system PorP/SprF family membrane protein
MKVKFFFLFFLSCTTQIKSQDLQYSQFYSNPIYLNPAFAGSTDLARIGVNYRNQWPALDQSFVGYTAYGDFYSDKYRSGLGMIFTGSRESFTQSQVNEIGVVYSYRVRFGQNSYMQVGVQGSFVSRDVMFDQVILGSQLDINNGIVIGGPGTVLNGDSKQRNADLHSGLLLYDERFWFGFSAAHLVRPQISYLMENGNKLPIKYSLQGGVKFELMPGRINDFLNNTNQERSMSFDFHYKVQGLYRQLDFGAEFYFEPLVLGMRYRGLPTKYSLPNHEALIGIVGVEWESGLALGYSFDFTLSKLGILNSGGAHELSMRYTFFGGDPRKKYRSALPSFRY